jgi:hypothetical protein
MGAIAAVGSCSDRPPERIGYSDDPDAAAAPDSTIVLDATSGPPSLDEAGYCGNQLISARVEQRNLYFIVDRSGSMGAKLPATSLNRFDAMREAVAAVLAEVGHRISFGAAVFPGIPAVNACAPGTEVFPTQPGDPAIYAATGTFGPVLTDFLTGLVSIRPDGGTPLSPTLVALAPALRALPGETFVVLATDGAPNCNPDAVCNGADCDLNFTQSILEDGTECSASTNCCDPRYTARGGGPIYCEDGPDSVQAISDLALLGIKTYVIGLPDSEGYTVLLDSMAVAGDTGHDNYYAVTDVADLAVHLRSIGAEVAIDCHIELDEEPPDPSLVNVYLDALVIPNDDAEGWTFTSPSAIEIRGEPCERLETGSVLNVQIVAGCPTEIR